MSKFHFVLIIFGILIRNSFQQPDVCLQLEQSLQQANENLIKGDANVAKRLSDLNAYIRISSLNLKAVNITPTLTSVLDSTFSTVRIQTSVKNFRSYFPFTNLSTCDYANFRMSFLDLDMRKLQSIIANIQDNFAQIYENFIEMTFNYAANYQTLVNYWTRELTIIQIIQRVLQAFNEYGKNAEQLKVNLKNYQSFYAYLSDMATNCSKSNSSFADTGEKIEDNLLKCQADLLSVQNLALAKVNAALMTVASPTISSTTPTTKKYSLQKMQKNYQKFLTKDDKKVAWPRIPDKTGMAAGSIPLKLRTCQERRDNLAANWKNHLKNRTELEDNQGELSSNVQSIRKVRSTDPAIDDVVNATLMARNQFTVCMQQLNDSMALLDQMITDYEIGIRYPCGTLLPYDPVNDPFAPVQLGVVAGTHIDGTIAYMGSGRANPIDQKNASGRISVKSRGFFAGQGSGISFDNTTAFFLVRHPDMQFVPTNASLMPRIPGIIRIQLGLACCPFAFGRKFNGSNVIVGKTHCGGGLFGLYYATGSAELVFGSDFEVLVCPCKNVDPGTPIPPACVSPVRLYDSKCVYRKTACRIFVSNNQTSQATYCQLNGMQKYSILSDVDYDLLEHFGRIGGLIGGAFGINGVQAANGTWFVYNPDPKRLWPGVSVSGSGCLIVDVGSGAKLSFRGLACNTTSGSLCEFY